LLLYPASSFEDTFCDSVYRYAVVGADDGRWVGSVGFVWLQVALYLAVAFHGTGILDGRPEAESIDQIFLGVALLLTTAHSVQDLNLIYGIETRQAFKGSRYGVSWAHFETAIKVKAMAAVFCSYCILVYGSGEALDLILDSVAILFLDDLDELFVDILSGKFGQTAKFAMTLWYGGIIAPGVALGVSFAHLHDGVGDYTAYICWSAGVALLTMFLAAPVLMNKMGKGGVAVEA